MLLFVRCYSVSADSPRAVDSSLGCLLLWFYLVVFSLAENRANYYESGVALHIDQFLDPLAAMSLAPLTELSQSPDPC